MIVSIIVSATQIQTNDKQIHHSQTTRTPSQSMPDHPHAYDAYQELASAYAEKINTKPHNAYYERPAMLSMLPKIAGMHVLDAGCGPGVYAQELAARGAQVIRATSVTGCLSLQLSDFERNFWKATFVWHTSICHNH